MSIGRIATTYAQSTVISTIEEKYNRKVNTAEKMRHIRNN